MTPLEQEIHTRLQTIHGLITDLKFEIDTWPGRKGDGSSDLAEFYADAVEDLETDVTNLIDTVKEG